MRLHPFQEDDTYSTFSNVVDKTVAEIDSLESDYVLKASPAELEQFYVDKVTITPLVLVQHLTNYYALLAIYAMFLSWPGFPHLFI